MITICLLVLGLCFGSFITALVWRVRQRAKGKSNKRYSMTQGRSMCPHCHHRLGALDLIPVLSWVALRGRCRYCQAKISWQYPAIELVTAALFTLSYWQWHYSFNGVGLVAFGAWLGCLVLLIALAIYDIRWMILPDRLIVPLTIFSAVLTTALAIEQGSLIWTLETVTGAILLSGLFWGLFQISGGRWIGGGDVKIAVALGLIAGGLTESVVLLFIASLLGTLVSIPLLSHRKSVSHKIAFGPFLITAAIIVFLWGAEIITRYDRLIGV